MEIAPQTTPKKMGHPARAKVALVAALLSIAATLGATAGLNICPAKANKVKPEKPAMTGFWVEEDYPQCTGGSPVPYNKSWMTKKTPARQAAEELIVSQISGSPVQEEPVDWDIPPEGEKENRAP